MDQEARKLATILVSRIEGIPSFHSSPWLYGIRTVNTSSTPPTTRLIVGLAGIPASGKSTLAELIVKYTNEILEASFIPPSSESTNVTKSQPSDVRAILVGLDGWHFTRAQLDAFPDPKLAHDRRGAHWTFDGESYANFIKQLRNPLPSAPIPFPTFSHALKDPSPSPHLIQEHHRIVLIEGLYTFLSIPPWDVAGNLLDERWFIDVGIPEASARLIKRHVVSGVAGDLEEAVWRAEENDMPNGKFIIDNMLTPTRRIASLEDPQFAIID